MTQVGVEKLKEVVAAVGGVVTSLIAFKEMDFGALKAEILNLDLAEKAEVAELFKTSFNLPNENVEANIEKGFDVLLTVAVLLGKFV